MKTPSSFTQDFSGMFLSLTQRDMSFKSGWLFKIMAWNLAWFDFIPLTSNQCIATAALVSNLVLRHVIEWYVFNKVLSSAWLYKLQTLSNAWKISFMKKLKISGPRMDPWGTPCATDPHSLRECPTFTRCFRSEIYDFNNRQAWSERP